jgi:hypothetical protein
MNVLEIIFTPRARNQSWQQIGSLDKGQCSYRRYRTPHMQIASIHHKQPRPPNLGTVFLPIIPSKPGIMPNPSSPSVTPARLEITNSTWTCRCLLSPILTTAASSHFQQQKISKSTNRSLMPWNWDLKSSKMMRTVRDRESNRLRWLWLKPRGSRNEKGKMTWRKPSMWWRWWRQSRMHGYGLIIIDSNLGNKLIKLLLDGFRETILWGKRSKHTREIWKMLWTEWELGE